MSNIPIKYKTTAWLDTYTLRVRYGIQVKLRGEKGWFNLIENDEILIYNSETEAKDKVKELNKIIKH